jgi:hypothetical protein
MKLKAGDCIKCGCKLMLNGKPNSLWMQKGFIMDDGNIMFVAKCKTCTIDPAEYGALSRALNLNRPIIDVAKRNNGAELEDTMVDIALEAQGSKCHFCGKPILDKYAISGGYICCERC